MRELVVLGTAAQVPTRQRSHNGYFLRWDAEGTVFDPGEGSQRQLTLAGVPASAITRICLTHLHGDHCLGLPGVVQRLALDGVTHPVDLCYPASGSPYVERLCQASIYDDHTLDLRRRAVDGAEVVIAGPPTTVLARPLDHRVDTVGWRLEEPDGVTMLPERLAACGVAGPDVGRLRREGEVRVGGRRVTLDQVSVARAGQRMAFVMDTRVCDAAYALAEGVDLLVCESTYLETERELAEQYGHLTAAQAATIAATAGVGRLVLTHFSQRHPDAADYLAEARRIFPDAIAAGDLMRVPLPPRRTSVRS